MIYIGADHAGYNLKEEIKKYLEGLGYEYEDSGAREYDKADDYPDFAKAVCQKVTRSVILSEAKDPEHLGILICSTGIGMSIAANKIKGIRAALCYDEFSARQSREHNNANVLCLGKDMDFKPIVKTWLESKFTGEERHKRRLKKIASF